MNDLLYYEPLADLFEADVTYRSASTQVRFGYLTLAASFHWNLLKLLGDISPTYHLAPSAADESTLVQLPYLNGSLKLHVKVDGVSSDDWLEHASATLLAEVHSDCMAPLLSVKSADAATTLLSNVGHTVVIRVVLNALRLAHRRTVDPAVLEEAISTLCLLSHRRYEGRIPELAVCFGHSLRRPERQGPAVHFGREFLGSKKSAVLLKGGTLLLHCLGNGRVVEVIDLDFASSGPVSDRILGPLGQISTLNYSYGHGAVTAILTRQGEVLIAMGRPHMFLLGRLELACVSRYASRRSTIRAADAGVHRQGEGTSQTSCSAHHHDCTNASRRSAWSLTRRVVIRGDDRSSYPQQASKRLTSRGSLLALVRGPPTMRSLSTAGVQCCGTRWCCRN